MMTTIKTILNPNPEVLVPDEVQNKRQELMYEQYVNGKLVVATDYGYKPVQELSYEELEQKLSFHNFVRSLYDNVRIPRNDDNDFALFIYQEEKRRRA